MGIQHLKDQGAVWWAKQIISLPFQIPESRAGWDLQIPGHGDKQQLVFVLMH